jgi:FkbM family methyltransferase
MKNAPLRDRFLAAYLKRGWRGFSRLYDFLKPAAARRVIQARTIYGSQFLLTPHDNIDHHVLTEGFYESEVIDALRPDLDAPDAVLWVVGANFGLHAVTAKLLHPTARVLAFEPSPLMAARVLENAALNGIEIELHTTALADAIGILPFHANATGNPGMSTLHPVPGLVYDHRFNVATTTAAAVIEGGHGPAPTVLLVDAEGAEESVLRGFGPHLARSELRRIVFEADNDLLTRPDALHALVTGAGFRIEKLVRHEQTAHALSNFLGTRQ